MSIIIIVNVKTFDGVKIKEFPNFTRNIDFAFILQLGLFYNYILH